jgi:amino acid adenylation domain-containing protein
VPPSDQREDVLSTQEIKPELVSFRLSPQQEHLWLLEPQGPTGRSQCAAELPSGLDPAAVSAALSDIVRRHEILRTTFRRQPGMRAPAQVIREHLEPMWASEERTELLSDGLDELLEEEARTAMDFEHGPLVRARLVSVDHGPQLLVLTAAAVCADAVSLGIVVRELADRLSSSPEAIEPGEPIQYADYAEWRNELLSTEDEPASEGRAFWAHDILPAPSLLFARLAGALGGSEVRRLALPIDPEDLSRGSAAHRTSEAVFLEACWHALIARLSGEAELVLASVVDGRSQDELRDAVGPFAQAVPIRTRPEENTSLAEVVDQVRRARGLAERWQELADRELLEKVAERCGLGFASAQVAGAGGTSFPVRALLGQPGRIDLQLCLLVNGSGDLAELQYNPAAIDPDDAAQVARHLAALVSSAAADATVAVGDLALMGDEERKDLLTALELPPADYPQACVQELFERHAAEAPGRVAVVGGGSSLTYGELNERANRLAHHLRALGVGRDVPVGLCLDRSPEMIESLLGILKAGGAYLPLNFEHPRARIAHQLEEAQAPVLVTQEALLDRLPAFEGSVVCVDRDRPTLELEPSSNPQPLGEPDDLVYVMYTSGSTGLPKGVAVTHRNLVNYTAAILQEFELDGAEADPATFAAVSAISTDLGNTSVFPSLLSGGSLHLIAPEVSMDGDLFASYVKAHPVDVLKITPSHLQALMADGNTAVLPGRWLVLGGEALPWELVDRIGDAGAGCRILNHYGPTETTVGSCVFEVGESPPADRPGTVPIGRPLANARAYVLDSRLQLLPPGVPGELCIAGVGVARGYVGQPEQTAEVFVRDPFSSAPEARLYRTGDRARFLRDGNIEFLGRLDDQVKIRGFRVEPAEIEAVLGGHTAVRQAAVVARHSNDGEIQLVCYVVAPAEPGVEELQTFLRESLPAYMVPSRFVTLDSLPLTPSGKIDRRALPDPAESARETSYVAPRTPLEEGLARIWAEVLGVERVGAFDDFFSLGGHSLLATQVVIRIRKAYADIPLHSIFDSPTVAALAEVVVEAEQEAAAVEESADSGALE